MELIFKHFAKLGETLCERITRLVSSLLDCFSVSTGDIYRSMARAFQFSNKKSPNAIKCSIKTDKEVFMEL
jgi:hypothetical protein